MDRFTIDNSPFLWLCGTNNLATMLLWPLYSGSIIQAKATFFVVITMYLEEGLITLK